MSQHDLISQGDLTKAAPGRNKSSFEVYHSTERQPGMNSTFQTQRENDEDYDDQKQSNSHSPPREKHKNLMAYDHKFRPKPVVQYPS